MFGMVPPGTGTPIAFKSRFIVRLTWAFAAFTFAFMLLSIWWFIDDGAGLVSIILFAVCTVIFVFSARAGGKLPTEVLFLTHESLIVTGGIEVKLTNIDLNTVRGSSFFYGSVSMKLRGGNAVVRASFLKNARTVAETIRTAIRAVDVTG